MLAEDGRDDHADPVVHPACLPEFAHASIDDGIAGAALFPGTEIGTDNLLVFFPREACEVLDEVLPADVVVHSGSGTSGFFSVLHINRPRFFMGGKFFACMDLSLVESTFT